VLSYTNEPVVGFSEI